MPSLTIALIGDAEDPWAGQQGRDVVGDGRPYRELPKVVVETSTRDHILDALSAASERFGVTFPDGQEAPPSWIAFYRSEDEEGYDPRRESTGVELLGDDGQLIWVPWWHDSAVTIEALISSAEAGALDGNAHRPYLILRPGYGNGILPSWAEFALMLFVMRDTLGIIADTQGAVDATKSVVGWAGRLLKRIRRVPEVVQQNADQWQEHGAYPAHWTELIDRQPWDSEVLARLLGITQTDAEILLAGRGFSLNRQSGLWHLGAGEEELILHRVMQTSMWLEWDSDYSSAEGKERLRTEIIQNMTEVIKLRQGGTMSAYSLPSHTVRATVTAVDDTDPLNVVLWIRREQDPPDADPIPVSFQRQGEHADQVLAQKAADLSPGDAMTVTYTEVSSEGVSVRLGRVIHEN